MAAQRSPIQEDATRASLTGSLPVRGGGRRGFASLRPDISASPGTVRSFYSFDSQPGLELLLFDNPLLSPKQVDCKNTAAKLTALCPETTSGCDLRTRALARSLKVKCKSTVSWPSYLSRD